MEEKKAACHGNVECRIKIPGNGIGLNVMVEDYFGRSKTKMGWTYETLL